MRGMKATLGIVLKIAALHIENITVRSKCTEMAKEKEAHAESLIVFLLLSKADLNGGEKWISYGHYELHYFKYMHY